MSVRDLRGNWRIDVAHSVGRRLRRTGLKGATKASLAVGSLLCPKVRTATLFSSRHYGLSFCLDPSADDLARQLYLAGTTEAGTIHVMDHVLRPADAFVDAGANFGLMTLRAAQLVGPRGQVHAFEPVPATCEILQSHVRLNGLENVRLNKTALGAAAGTAHMSIHPTNKGIASIRNPGDDALSPIEVRVETLEEYAAANGAGPFRMIKVDVEGFELEVLKGARRLLEDADGPVLCCEYCRQRPLYDGRPSEDLYRFIKTVNPAYSVYRLKSGMNKVSKLVEIDDERHLPAFDNLFCFLPPHFETLSESLFQ
jgi:FkbM family methyltransferase